MKHKWHSRTWKFPIWLAAFWVSFFIGAADIGLGPPPSPDGPVQPLFPLPAAAGTPESLSADNIPEVLIRAVAVQLTGLAEFCETAMARTAQGSRTAAAYVESASQWLSASPVPERNADFFRGERFLGFNRFF